MPELYTFTAAPHSDDPEWMGTLAGVSNMVTRAKEPLPVVDRNADSSPGKLESLLESARRVMAGRQLFINDAVIHGVRVRCNTDSFHLADFWRENWFNPLEWRQRTGSRPADKPQVHVYAITRAPEEPRAAYYSRQNHTLVYFNTSHYGQLKSLTLGAVGRLLAEERGVHTLSASALQKDGRGALFLGPAASGKSTVAYGLMEFPGTRLHSDDAVFVQYGYRRPNGQVVCPLHVGGVRGAACFRWLETHRGSADPVDVLSLDHEQFQIPASELDADSISAHAFLSEKSFYLRTNLVESFASFVPAFLRSKVENVPDISSQLLAHQSQVLDALIPAAGRVGLPREKLREMILRLYASGQSRAIFRPETVYGADRVVSNPAEPLKLDAVFLLQQRPDETVAEGLSLESFCARLLEGETPEGRREIAYNAHRASDDRAESEYLDMLRAVRERTKAATIFHVHEGIPASRAEKPPALQAELELFRQLHKACRAYEINMSFAGRIPSRRESVRSVARLLSRVLDGGARDLKMTIHDLERA